MKNETPDIQGSFDETLEKSNLLEIGGDVAELSIDHFIDEGLVREIPIVKTLVSFMKIGANIHDRLFLKKILSFLNGLQRISAEARLKMIKEIDESKKYRVKVGEKLLFIIDSCNDHQASELVARMFAACIEGRIGYDDFLASSAILKDINVADLKWFLESDKEEYKIAEVGNLVGSGLFEVDFEEINVYVEDQDDYKVLMDGGNKYVAGVEGGIMWAVLTPAGRAIKDVLGQSKPA